MFLLCFILGQGKNHSKSSVPVAVAGSALPFPTSGSEKGGRVQHIAAMGKGFLPRLSPFVLLSNLLWLLEVEGVWGLERQSVCPFRSVLRNYSPNRHFFLFPDAAQLRFRPENLVHRI